ncbi:hypothetical protein NL676_007159 [Syzygium grande]|nr:hypothetical protein NL676_007159 [Syzygium grande]
MISDRFRPGSANLVLHLLNLPLKTQDLSSINSRTGFLGNVRAETDVPGANTVASGRTPDTHGSSNLAYRPPLAEIQEETVGGRAVPGEEERRGQDYTCQEEEEGEKRGRRAALEEGYLK